MSRFAPDIIDVRGKFSGTRAARARGLDFSAQQNPFFSADRDFFSFRMSSSIQNHKKNQKNDLWVFQGLLSRSAMPKKYRCGLKCAGYFLTTELSSRIFLRARGGNTACSGFKMQHPHSTSHFAINNSQYANFVFTSNSLTIESQIGTCIVHVGAGGRC